MNGRQQVRIKLTWNSGRMQTSPWFDQSDEVAIGMFFARLISPEGFRVEWEFRNSAGLGKAT